MRFSAAVRSPNAEPASETRGMSCAPHALTSAWTFQGLIKSALLATVARPERIFGFSTAACARITRVLVYSTKVSIRSPHAVERNLDLAAAAGASSILRTFPLPNGDRRAACQRAIFVLASPLAGWGGEAVAARILRGLARKASPRLRGLPLVLIVSRSSVDGVETHVSGIAGLIHATRRATAVIGVDSGPHSIGGPHSQTGSSYFLDPPSRAQRPLWRNIQLLRSPTAATTYKRTSQPDISMRGDFAGQGGRSAGNPSFSREQTRMSVFPKPYADQVARLRRRQRLSCWFWRFAWFSQPDKRSLIRRLAGVAQSDCYCEPGPPGILRKHDAGRGWAVCVPPQSTVSGNPTGGRGTSDRHPKVAAGSFVHRGVVLIFSLPVDELEQQHLKQAVSKFRRYSKRVPSLWPTLRPVKSEARFQWNLYFRNQEYQAITRISSG